MMNNQKYTFGLLGSFAGYKVFNTPIARFSNFQLLFSVSIKKEINMFCNSLDAVQFICIDLLDDRTEMNKIWEQKHLEFIDKLKSNFKQEHIFLFEFYLTERFEESGNPMWHPDVYKIRQINDILKKKYTFIKNEVAGINSIKLSLVLSYTDKYHENGCLPEHFNILAYQYIAQKLADKIEKFKNIPEKDENINKRNDFIMNQNTISESYRMDAYKNSCKYRTLRDWMYKKSISRTLDKYIIEKGFKTIAIYGMAEIGQLFLWEMQELNVEVKYAIDANADILFAEIPILKPDSELPEVDAIIVCVPFAFEEIKYSMMQKTKTNILSIDELIYEA